MMGLSLGAGGSKGLAKRQFHPLSVPYEPRSSAVDRGTRGEEQLHYRRCGLGRAGSRGVERGPAHLRTRAASGPHGRAVNGPGPAETVFGRDFAASAYNARNTRGQQAMRIPRYSSKRDASSSLCSLCSMARKARTVRAKQTRLSSLAGSVRMACVACGTWSAALMSALLWSSSRATST